VEGNPASRGEARRRILVGEDAKTLDALARAHPEAAYDYAELGRLAAEAPAATPPER